VSLFSAVSSQMRCTGTVSSTTRSMAFTRSEHRSPAPSMTEATAGCFSSIRSAPRPEALDPPRLLDGRSAGTRGRRPAVGENPPGPFPRVLGEFGQPGA
jgi:hypothetical protein